MSLANRMVTDSYLLLHKLPEKAFDSSIATSVRYLQDAQ